MDFNKLIRRTPPKESVVVLFGTAQDPEVKASINKIAIVKRRTELVVRPSFETGLGRCGKHLCSCKHTCMKVLGGPGQQFA
jgi:hypothetical protein